MNILQSTYRRIPVVPRQWISRVLLRRRSVATKRDDWFRDYHSDAGRQVIGLRDKTDARRRLFRVEDMQGRSVLDAGCNMGAIANHCLNMGASKVVGLDFDSTAVRKARELYTDPRLTFRCDDLDNPLVMLEPFDTVLFLSVYGTKELEDRNSILSRLSVLATVMYFEGHHGDDPRHCAWVLLKYGGFQAIEFLGYTTDELREGSVGRPFFRCDRVARPESFLRQYLHARAGQPDAFKVAVVGRSGAGKSHLAEKLAEEDCLTSLTILDDVADPQRLQAAEKLVLLDYRAGAYLDQTDTVFFLDVAENERLRRIAADPRRADDYNAFLKTPPVRPNFLSFFRIESTHVAP